MQCHCCNTLGLSPFQVRVRRETLGRPRARYTAKRELKLRSCNSHYMHEMREWWMRVREEDEPRTMDRGDVKVMRARRGRE